MGCPRCGFHQRDYCEDCYDRLEAAALAVVDVPPSKDEDVALTVAIQRLREVLYEEFYVRITFEDCYQSSAQAQTTNEVWAKEAPRRLRGRGQG